METPYITFGTLQLNIGKATVWKGLRIIPLQCNWVPGNAQLENDWKQFQYDAIELRLGHFLEMRYNLSGTMQMNLV